MARSTKQQAQEQAQQAQAPKQEQAKTKGALTPSAAVRLWNGEPVARSMLVAEQNGLSVLATELTLVKKTRTVQVATKRRAEVRNGRIHALDKPVQLGQADMLMDEALTQDEAAARASKWLKRAASLDKLAKEGDEEAKAKAKQLRESAKVLARAYGLQINKDGSVAVKSEQPAEPANK